MLQELSSTWGKLNALISEKKSQKQTDQGLEMMMLLLEREQSHLKCKPVN